MNGPLCRMLSKLPQAEPDLARANRVRVRCHAALARVRRRQAAKQAPGRFWEPIVAGLGGIYLTESIRQALSLYGLL